MYDHRWRRELKRSAVLVRIMTNHSSFNTSASDCNHCTSRQKREGQIGPQNASVEAAQHLSSPSHTGLKSTTRSLICISAPPMSVAFPVHTGAINRVDPATGFVAGLDSWSCTPALEEAAGSRLTTSRP